MNLAADVETGFETGFPDICAALGELRKDLIELVADLDPSEWQRPSRCHRWTVHHVVRHLRDGSKLHLAALRGDPPRFRPDDPYDNRDIPLRWLAESEGEQPDATARDLAPSATAEIDALSEHARQDGDNTLIGPYGRTHWTVLTAHVFWDAWLHVRDITEALGRPHRASQRQDLAAAHYGLLVASVPPAAMGEVFDITVRVTDSSRHAFDVHVKPKRADLAPGSRDEAADLEGDLIAVVDSLAGRGPTVDAVLTGDAAARELVSHVRHFLVSE